MAKDGRRSLGSIGDISGQMPDMPGKSKSDGKSVNSTVTRVLTVIAYIIGVSTAAALLSAYYVFLWVPHPSEPLQRRPTDSPFSLAQHGNAHLAGSSYHHHLKNTYSNQLDSAKHMPPSRGSKKSHTYKSTIPPNLLPKPQYLVRTKRGTRPPHTTPSP